MRSRRRFNPQSEDGRTGIAIGGCAGDGKDCIGVGDCSGEFVGRCSSSLNVCVALAKMVDLLRREMLKEQ